jgi:O-antigen ligase
MPPAVASLIFALGGLGLFWLDRDPESRVSPALWIPITWLAIGGSRSVTLWMAGVNRVAISADQYLEGSPLDRNFLTVLILGALIVLFMRGERTKEILRRNWPLIVFVLYCAISAAWSDFPFVTLKRWTKALGNITMVLVVLTEIDPTAALKRLITRTAFILIPASVVLIKYYPEMGRYYDRWEGTAYYSGVSTDKNMLGCICLVLGLGMLWRLVDAWRGQAPGRNGRLAAIGTVLAMDLWLFHTANSATSLACFMLGGLLIVTLGWFRPGRPALAHLMIGSMLSIALVGFLFQDAFSILVGSLGRNTTLTGRTDLWADLIQMNTKPWFGAGFESFFLGDRLEVLWSKYWWHPNEAHNGYLETYLTLGRVGISILLVVMLAGYRNVIDLYRRDSSAGSVRLAYLAIAPVYNITEAAFKVTNPVWILFLLAVTAVPDWAAQSEKAAGVEASPSTAPAGASAREPERTAKLPNPPAWRPPSPATNPHTPVGFPRPRATTGHTRGV